MRADTYSTKISLNAMVVSERVNFLLLNFALLEGFRFDDEDDYECEIFPILSSAHA